MDRDEKISVITYCVVVTAIMLAICIGPWAVDAYEEHKQMVADYERCVNELHNGKHGYAKVWLEDLHQDGTTYRDSLVLYTFAEALSLKNNYQNPKEIEEVLNRIPSAYAGDCAEDIAEFRVFLKNEYPALYEAKEEERRKTDLELKKLIKKWEREQKERESEQKQKEKEEAKKIQEQRERIANTRKRYESSKKKKQEMPDCDDYEDYDEFIDDWDGEMPDGSDAEDYWENW